MTERAKHIGSTVTGAATATGLLPLSVLAQDSAPSVVDNGQHLTQVFVALMLVIGLIFALAWLLKKMGNGSLAGNQHIKLVSNMPLGTRERIALIEVGDKQMLVGVTAHQINHLHTFDDVVVDTANGAEPSEFSKKIKEIIANGGNKL